VRRRLAAALLAPLLLLTACSGNDSASPTPSTSASSTSGASAEPTPTAADIAALAAVKVTGPLGAQPTVDFAKPFNVSAPVARVDTKGTGAPLVKGQSVALHLIQVSGADGSVSGATYTTKPVSVVLGSSELPTAMNDVFNSQAVGVRVVFAIPKTAAQAGATTAPADTAATILVMEVVSAKDVPARASGTAVPPVAGQPTVTLSDKGEPTITKSSAPAPTTLVVQPLIKGAGAPVTSGQSVTIHYTGALWDGTVFDSSWTKGAPITTTIGTGQVIPGWDQGLVGQTVGSQVLLIIPPSLGYGATANGPIPANSTLVFVVDILDAS
jgi:FKBP-type peptidyl-prolyl cis-trans isomerase 2